ARHVGHEAAGVHHATRRHGGGVAARGARAAGGYAGGWVLQPRVTRSICYPASGAPHRPERRRASRRAATLHSIFAGWQPDTIRRRRLFVTFCHSGTLRRSAGIGRMSTRMRFVLHLFSRVRNTLPVTTFGQLPTVDSLDLNSRSGKEQENRDER